MRRLRRLSRRSALWIGFFAVLGPLLVLLGLQFRWLATLAQDSAIARRATLENYLEAVTSEVHYHYSALAERGLNLPLSLFDGEPDLDEALQYFRQRVFDGANWLFIAYPAEGGEARAVFFDPRCECWGEPPDEQVQAVHVAAAPWLMLAQQGTILGSGGLHVDERNVAARTILNPITDEARHVVGIAGMIVDPDEFRELVLPAAIEKSLPKFFSENPLTHFMVQVEDGGGDLLYTSRRPDGGEEDLEVLMAATRPFGFIFKDWGVAVQRHGGSAEEWARTNFLLNLTLSGLLGVLLIGGSVFTLRTAAREVRLSEMKSDFVSNVSHELRTPLASIQAFGELLRRGKVKDGGRAREYGDYIETESRRLGDLIGNILDFSSIESGERSYRFEKVDFAAAVADVLATFEIRAREAGFQVVLEERPTEPLWVRADRQAVAQALTNLLDNAFKFSGTSREIRLRLDEDDGFARLLVQDFGVGISKQEQAKIFDRFHRVGNGLLREVRGSGLGLSIVHHIVEEHGGDIVVESAPGRGSTFVVRFPLALEGAELAAAEGA